MIPFSLHSSVVPLAQHLVLTYPICENRSLKMVKREMSIAFGDINCALTIDLEDYLYSLI